MQEKLKEATIQSYGFPVNTPKDCVALADSISDRTNRNISSTTLRRFFGLMPSKSAFSLYVLDTLSIYCGEEDFRSFNRKQHSFKDYIEVPRMEIITEIKEITDYTLNSISRKSLTDFHLTIARRILNDRLEAFLESKHAFFPLVAPGGYGKSVALAHWVKGQKDGNICLLLPASLFISMLDPKGGKKQIVHFNLGSWGNIFNVFLSDASFRNKKFILIIDALDEISSEPDKLYTVVDFLFNVANRFSYQNKIKMIFSVRESVWHVHLANRFERVRSKQWFDGVEDKLDSGYTNLSVLTNSEIKEIISGFNQESDTPLVYECIPWDIREIIRIPINLHLISRLMNNLQSLNLVSRIDVISAYLKEFVFSSRFAEEKEDIIWKVIELMEDQVDDHTVVKNELKKHLPIHLKRETAYYRAYNDLLHQGILIEYREENRFGIFVSRLGFKHIDFYYYLSALYLIKENGGIDFDLFLRVSGSGNNGSWAASIMAILFQIAYNDEDHQTLMRFCEMPEEILGSLIVRTTVGKCFRISNSIRDRLVEQYASSRLGQIYFFERFVDTNYLFNNYVFRIGAYLKHAPGKESGLFGNCILFLAGFLKMDPVACKTQMTVIEGIRIERGIYPWPVGRSVTSRILYTWFVEHGEIDPLDDLIHKYSEIAYSYPGYLERGLVEYELSIMVALVLVQQFGVLERMLERIRESYDQEGADQDTALMPGHMQNLLPVCFLAYARYKQGHARKPEVPRIWEEAINSFATIYDDYQYLILLHWFLCDYYFSEGDPGKAMEYYDTALEISRFADYDFFSAFLMKNIPVQEPESVEQAEKRIADSGFNRALFDYRMGPDQREK